MVRYKQKQKNTKVILIIILIAIAGLCAFAYYYSDIFNFRRLFIGQTTANAKSVMKIQYNADQKPQFIPYENNLLLVDKEGIKAYSISNKVEWSIKQNFSNPIVVVEDKYLSFAEKGGKEISLYQGNKKLWTKTTDGEITKIKLNKNGYVLVFKKDAESGEILGYNLKGTSIIKKSYAKQGFLVNADISSDGKKVAALSVYTGQEKISSRVDIFEIKSTREVNSKPVSGFTKDDLLAVDIKIFNNGSIVLLSDSKVVALDGTGNEKWSRDLTNPKVYKANITSGSYIVLETSGTVKSNLIANKSREIIVLNSDGVEEKGSKEQIKISLPVDSMDVFENYFIVNDTSKLYSISKGNLIWSYPLAKDIKYAKAFQGKSQILLVSRDSAEVIEVN